MVRDPISHKNVKFFYYAKGSFLEALRQLGHKKPREQMARLVGSLDSSVLEKRLAYYNKLQPFSGIDKSGVLIGDLELPRKNKAYYFDLIEFTRYFPDTCRINYLFGDITKVPENPTVLKSRPIQGENSNSVLYKFNRIRHYTFANDRIPYEKKKNILIGRANVKQEHRREFLRKYFEHPMCDLGQINSGTKHDQWLKKKISINDHLRYKFIWSQEGYDVASNLKWIMSSNSIAVMPNPKYETWFMEGMLQPDVHYIALKDDFSDLEERLNYYMEHKSEALQIIANANAYVKKFRNPKMEKALRYLVLDKYFVQSGQLKPMFPKWY